MGFIVEKSGALTTIQDKGRYGMQQYGVNVSGAMDLRSMQIANILVGNAPGEAVLEATLLGPGLRFTSDTVIAVTGGDLGLRLNGVFAPVYRAISIKNGDILDFTQLKSGCRAYIAFAGGLDIPEVFGSKSTNLRSGFGGYRGRALKAGDTVEFQSAVSALNGLERRRVEPEQFQNKKAVIRVIRGPQDDYFTEEGYRTFFTGTYRQTLTSDRQGTRLEGPVIQHSQKGNTIISDGVAAGSIQVPPNGLPIIMLADRQTVGGYAKIATVISVDQPLLAQLCPGAEIVFQEVTVEEAQRLYRAESASLRALASRMGALCTVPAAAPSAYTVTVNGTRYDVLVERVIS